MINKYPLLSICIPTYNRADILDLTLASIVGSNCFADNIEVIISDNCSTDNTEDIVIKYSKTNNNIKYFRSDENLGAERNFIKVLSLASGKFLKLHNDYSCFTKNGLRLLYDIVNTNESASPFLFFSNGALKTNSPLEFSSLDDFVTTVEYGITWIGSYGFWKTRFDTLENKDTQIESRFMQIDWLLRIFVKEKKCVVYNDVLTVRKPFKEAQGGYHFIKVHLIDFLAMFIPYVEKGLLSNTTVDVLKRKILPVMLNWIYILNIKKDPHFSYESDKSISILFRNYCKHIWFYTDTVKWLIIRMFGFLGKIPQRVETISRKR